MARPTPTPSPRLLRARARWQYRGAERPPFAEPTAEGETSVWDHPRPPRIEPYRHEVRVEARGEVIAASRHALCVLETASPPTVYLPPADLVRDRLVPKSGDGPSTRTICEWKGAARAWCLAAAGSASEPVAWSYPEPFEEFLSIRDFVAFHPALVHCWSDGERVVAQAGGYYGGWITPGLRGPFKGAPGSEDW